MSVDAALRFVEERNSSRNLSPAPRPAGLRLQLAVTSTSVVVCACRGGAC